MTAPTIPDERGSATTGTVAPFGPVGPVGPLAAHEPLPLDAVRLDPSGHFGAWQALTDRATVPHCVEQVEQCGALDNLRRVVGESDADFRGYWFADSDVHKTLEAVAWRLARVADEELTRWLDDITRLLARVQDDDGYLDSCIQGVKPDDRWAELHWSHETYVMGHLVQAGIAAARGLGDTALLDVAVRAADLLARTFGPGGRAAADGHPGIEMALVELSRLTGRSSYQETARAMIEARGHGLLGDQPYGRGYFQDHVPVRDAVAATGHAVRQLYLAAGAVDVAIETGDRQLLAASERMWEDVVGRRSYVTGGVGSRHRDEAFGDPYELPSERAYAETCAAIAGVMWNWRLLLATGRRRYADEIERLLFNAVPAGLAGDGRHFFYSNPLQRRTEHDGSVEDSPAERLPWYAIPCCPPNLARLGATLQTYVATWDRSGDLVLQQYAAGRVRVATPRGELELNVETSYPWDGAIVVTVDAASGAVGLRLRVPGWATGVRASVAGRPIEPDSDGYVSMAGPLPPGTRVVLEVPMPVRMLRPSPRVDAVRGCVALVRGPVVYCVEALDLPEDVDVDDLTVAPGSRFEEVPGTVGGQTAVLLRGVAHVTSTAEAPLYSEAEPPEPTRRIPVTAVPYALWANRGVGGMRVWLPVACTARDQPSAAPNA